jgi:DNA polymerase-4
MIQRKIIHIDMDAFFASVEQRDHPEWRGKPLAVGGSRQRGVVAAASYEARAFGVRSAMASVQAQRLCPEIIFTPPRFEVYKEVSDQIRAIFLEFTDLVEPLSLDEAFLDVTHNKKNLPSATLIAAEIRKKIVETTGLTASAGISVNKFLAKVATDIHKPNGMTLIPPDKVNDFIAALPVKKFFGVGAVTAERMQALGIRTGADLLSFTRPELVRLFGKSGAYFYEIVRGIDNRPVKPDRIRKSVGVEDTFRTDISDRDELLFELDEISVKVHTRLVRTGLKARTLHVKYRYNDFSTFTRSRSREDFSDDLHWIRTEAKSLFLENIEAKPIRLMGLSVSNLNIRESETMQGQLTLDF